MRILVVGPQFPDSFARNIAVTLQQMGFEVEAAVPGLVQGRQDQTINPLVNLGMRVWPSLEKRVQEKFVRGVEKAKPELVLVTYGGLTPRTVKRLREICPAVVAWYPDAAANLDREYLLGADYDCVFFKERRAVSLFRNYLGLPAYFLPECCNPLWHRRGECTKEELSKFGCDVAIAGNLYYYRLRMLEELSGVDLKIWGGAPARWLCHPVLRFHQRYYVAQDEKAKAFCAARVVLNTFHHKETDGVNCRLFEATGCGGFVLTENRPALGNFFVRDEEVAVFDSREGLVDRVRYYLAHPEEREMIARRGYQRAHRDHTYDARLRKLLEVVSHHTGVRLLPEGSPAYQSGEVPQPFSDVAM